MLHQHFFRRFFDNENLTVENETETTVIRALCAFAVPALMVAFWLLPRYPGRDLWAAASDRCGAGLSLLLADLLFLGRTQIPFTRARMPGRGSLPLVLTLYAALFPALVFCTVQLELHAERRGAILIWVILSIAATHLFLKWIDFLAQRGIIGGFPEDETDEGPQVLGLSQ